jgi:hypothetical protein
MATRPAPPCGYSYDVIEKRNYLDGNLCCTFLCDNGVPCGWKLKDHLYHDEMKTQILASQQTGKLTLISSFSDFIIFCLYIDMI